MEPELSILNLPHRCRHLESKGMYVNAGLTPDQYPVQGDGHVWCAMTQGKFGPDNGLCNPEECVKSGRTCFVPL